MSGHDDSPGVSASKLDILLEPCEGGCYIPLRLRPAHGGKKAVGNTRTAEAGALDRLADIRVGRFSAIPRAQTPTVDEENAREIRPGWKVQVKLLFVPTTRNVRKVAFDPRLAGSGGAYQRIEHPQQSQGDERRSEAQRTSAELSEDPVLSPSSSHVTP